MKCPHCGGEHPASYKFCPVTGKEIDAHHGMKAFPIPIVLIAGSTFFLLRQGTAPDAEVGLR